MPSLPIILHTVCVLLAFALTLGTLPLAVELLLLSLAAIASRPETPSSRSTSGLSLTVIIPAHNEEKLIAACVRSLVESSAPDVTVVVVAHNCTDATACEARQAGATVLPLVDTTGGKGAALDCGFRHALAEGADAVLVIDADSVVSPNLTSTVTQRFQAGAQALQCRYVVGNAFATPQTRLSAFGFLGMNVLRPLGRERLGFSCGIFGNGFALCAASLTRVPYVANSLVEDLEYHLHLIRAGIRVQFVNDATVFGEMPEASEAASTQRARWEGGRILMRRQWTFPLLRQVFSGRLRLLEPLLDLLCVPLTTQAALLVLALLLSLSARLLWLRLYTLTGIFAILLYFLVSAFLAPQPLETLRALLSAPGYLVWKIFMIRRTHTASRDGAAWIRTPRNAENPATLNDPRA